MEHNRKRHASRPPLAETSTNVPVHAAKKAKLKAGIASGAGLGVALATGEASSREAAREAARDSAKDAERRTTEDERRKDDHASRGDKTRSARLVGDELKSWQASWRKIMRESVVYFDTQGCDTSSTTQHQEQKRAQRALKLVGCEIVPFYDRDVSIIVSRRPFQSAKVYQSNDIFHDAAALKIKVWDYDKVFRFLRNLGVDAGTAERLGNLMHLLKEEKIFGATDRDPTARRDDLYYLEKNFLYVYDLSQAVRPIAVREWLGNLYPALHMTLDGKCPFIADVLDNLERKKMRRRQKLDATREYRELLRAASLGKHESPVRRHQRLEGSESQQNLENRENQENADRERLQECQVDGGKESEARAMAGSPNAVDDTKGPEDGVFGANALVPQDSKHGSGSDAANVTIAQHSDDYNDFKAPALTRHSSTMPTNSLKFYDVAASGYNGASNAVQYLMDSALNSAAQGNGLGPAVSQVVSKNINNLKRRIFMKRQMQKPDTRDRDLRPGYCENCRVKYDHFDDHIESNRHRNFACNDKNFKEIDELIATLNESKCMGYVSSNGDYSVAS